MTEWGRRISGHSRLVLSALPFILILLVLVIFLPPDGNERADLAQFVGRFHPLAVHFPIALILLVPILDLSGRSSPFPYLRLTPGFALTLAPLTPTLAYILGRTLH